METNPTRYCELALALETTYPDLPADTTAEEDIPAVKEFAASELTPLAIQAEAELEQEDLQVREAAETFYGAYEELAETGSFDVWEEPQVARASRTIHTFNLENCGWSSVEMTTVDYSFEEVPEQIDPGPASFEIENTGAEVHEMALYRFRKEAVKPIGELVALEETDPEIARSIEFVTSVDVRPGEDEGVYAIADLKPGKYGMVCFVPLGSTPEVYDQLIATDRETESEPHAAKGMFLEFTVQAGGRSE